MDLQSLMQNFSMGAGNSQGPVVEFNAGKVNLETRPNNRFMCTPDLAKGAVQLARGVDGLIHFKWKNRITNQVVDDMMVFPDSADFKKINTGREGDRVYCLQYRGSSRRMLFWMQAKDDSKDQELCNKVNEVMNNTTASGQSSTASTSGSASDGGLGLDQSALLRMLGGGGTGSSGLPTPPLALPTAANAGSSGSGSSSQPAGAGGTSSGGGGGAAGDGGSVQLSDLQSILQSMGVGAAAAGASTSSASAGSAAAGGGDSSSTPAAGDTPAASAGSAAPAASGTGALTTGDVERAMMSLAAGMAQAMQLHGGGASRPPTRLSSALTTDAILESGILEDEAVVAKLRPLLPATGRTEGGAEGGSEGGTDELLATITSAQFRASLDTLSAALDSENYNSIFANFGLDPSHPRVQAALTGSGGEGVGGDGGGGDAVMAFLEAVIACAQEGGSNSSSGGGGGGGDESKPAGGREEGKN